MIITAKNGNFSYRMSASALCCMTITPPISTLIINYLHDFSTTLNDFLTTLPQQCLALLCSVISIAKKSKKYHKKTFLATN